MVVGRSEGEADFDVVPVQPALLYDLRIGADVEFVGFGVEAEFAVGLPVGFVGALAQGEGDFADAVAVDVKHARVLAAVAAFVLPGELFLQLFECVLLFALGFQQVFAQAGEGVQLALHFADRAAVALQALDEGAAHVAVVFDALPGDGQRLLGFVRLVHQRLTRVLRRQRPHALPGEARAVDAQRDVGDVVAEKRRDDDAVHALFVHGDFGLAHQFGFPVVKSGGNDRRVEIVVFRVGKGGRDYRQQGGQP